MPPDTDPTFADSESNPKKPTWTDVVSGSFAERRAFVLAKLESGELQVNGRDDREILRRGLRFLGIEQGYFVQRIGLGKMHPRYTAPLIKTGEEARFFIESFGLEQSKSLISSEVWLSAYTEKKPRLEQDPQTYTDIRKLLKSRGANRVTEDIKTLAPEKLKDLASNKDWGEGFVKIFGLKAVQLLPPSLAGSIKGGHLEEALGL